MVPFGAVMLLGLNTNLPLAATSTCKVVSTVYNVGNRQAHVDLGCGARRSRRHWCGRRGGRSNRNRWTILRLDEKRCCQKAESEGYERHHHYSSRTRQVKPRQGRGLRGLRFEQPAG